MRTYRNYTDDDIIKATQKVTSLAGLIRELGLKPAGGNYTNFKRKLQKLGLCCSHWKGHAWNKEQRLKDWSSYTKATSLRPHLIKERGHRCETCRRSKWLHTEIPLEVHHVNGDKTDNSQDNLKLLCPNCHALTPNFRNRKL